MRPSSSTAFATTDVADYLDVAADHLRSDPVAHSVLLTTPLTRPEPVDPDVPNLWCWAEHEGQVVAAAQQTPPFGAQVSTGNPEGLAALAGLLYGRRPDLPWVGGMRPAVEAFTAAWPGEVGEVERAMLVYACDDVVPARPVPGSMRLARAEDAAQLGRWVAGFKADTGAPAPPAQDLDRRIATQRLWVWDLDGVPVSMAAASAPVADMTRVQLVYAPPEQRGRGWAAACVAAVTRLQLEQGLRCMLYADAANPTSNGVYTRIGYRHVADAVDVRLRP